MGKLNEMSMFSDDLFNVFDEPAQSKDAKAKKRPREDNRKTDQSDDATKKAKVKEKNEPGPSHFKVEEASTEESQDEDM